MTPSGEREAGRVDFFFFFQRCETMLRYCLNVYNHGRERLTPTTQSRENYKQ